MALKKIITAFLAATAVGASAFATDSYSDAVVENLTAMKAVYQALYAPADWKKQYAGYDLQTNYDDAVAAVRSKQTFTQQDARTVLKNFIYSMRDYHTSISFISTETARLPFAIKSVGDRFFIVYIDRSKLSEKTFPFHVGDELISVDGRPILDVITDFQNEIPENVPVTDRALAEMRFTERAASRGLSVPQGPVMLGILPQGSSVLRFQQLLWEYTPETVAPRLNLTPGLGLGVLANSGTLLRSPMMSVDVDSGLKTIAGNPYALGTKKAFTPALGLKIWESPADSVFDAYIYQTPDRRLVGYVRIASYSQPDYVKAVNEFRALMARFERVTDALVIDQVNNPGGSVFYLYALASMLTDKPLYTPLHRMAVSQAEVLEAKNTVDQLKNIHNEEQARQAMSPADIAGYEPSYEFVKFMRSYAQFIMDEWTAGRTLTRPYWIAGVNYINPSAVHYTKPVLVLINHLDFSGGDFFPTILQDNKRVTIMGTRTAGAGGYVNDIRLPNNIGVAAFRVTESIATRIDGNPIENLGVTPDKVYEMTVEDYTQNYAPYVRAINATVNELLSGTKLP